MRTSLSHAVLAAALSLGFIGKAQAIPVTFEGSGAFQGQTATIRFEFETDAMRNFRFGPASYFTDLLGQGDRPSPMRVEYTLGSESISLNDTPVNGYGGVTYNDVCTPLCSPFALENFAISVYQQDFPYGSNPPGPVHSWRSLSLTAYAPVDPLTGEQQDYFDLNLVTAESVLTLPLFGMRGVYWEATTDCTSGSCIDRVTRTDQFTIDSVTRVTASTSVPEPGTFGLLGAALVGMFFLRRRMPASVGPTTSASTR